MKMRKYKRSRIIASVAVLGSLAFSSNALAADSTSYLNKNGWNGHEITNMISPIKNRLAVTNVDTKVLHEKNRVAKGKSINSNAVKLHKNSARSKNVK